MLSILIPVYCYQVGALVRDLVNQLQPMDFDWEIRVYDDASPQEQAQANAAISTLDKRVVYNVLERNLGRAAIRNRLAQDARFSTLLFLDADGEIPEKFLATYAPYIGQDAVISGGRYYNDNSIHPEQQLHWNYGYYRESKPAVIRQQRPYQGFQTNNFLAPKALMLLHPFDEAATAYGHEDTLWGWQLKALGIQIVHIDNAVAHLGLEDKFTFLQKQQTAVATLKILESNHPELPSRLGQFARKTAWAKPMLIPIIKTLRPIAKKQLLRTMPGSLYWLDLLKLGWYWEVKE